MRTTDYNQWLLPYLEGTLDSARTAELEAHLATEPSLAAEAEHLRQTLDSLRLAASRSPSPVNAAPPADLWPSLRGRLAGETTPRRRTPPRFWWTAVAGLAAASLILAGVILQPQSRISPSAPRAVSTSTAPRQTAAPTVAVPATVPPVARPPRQIASVPKPPVGSADPFALPVPSLSMPPALPQTVPNVPQTPVPTTTAKKPPVQIASRYFDTSQNPEIAPKFAAPPALSVPPAFASPAPVVSRPLQAAPPAPAGAMASRTVDSAFGASAGMNSGEQKPALKESGPPKTATSATAAADQVQKAKSSPNDLYQSPGLLFRKRDAAKNHEGDSLNALRPAPTLDDWTNALAAAVRSPLWGENAGMQQANQALLNTQMAGRLNDLRAQLETQRANAPSDVFTGRMLAAVDEFSGFAQAALEERRRAVTLDGVGGEDWFALAQLEERAGNGRAAKAAYQHALASPMPPTPFHAAIARQRSQ